MRRKKFYLQGFAESISFNKNKKLWAREERDPSAILLSTSNFRISTSRIYFFYVVVFVTLLIFLAQLFHLAVIEGSENRNLAENNRIKLIAKEAERGRIFDKNGAEIAKSYMVYLLIKGGKTTEITSQQAAELEAEGLAGENFEGELGTVKAEMRRDYLLGESGAHVLGYASVPQEKDLRNQKDASFQSVGRLGIEQTYNDFLTGEVGKKLVEVDTFGKKVSVLGEEESKRGQDLTTTLDAPLQRVAFSSLKNQAEKIGTKKGAIIATNPNTGEVLALASMPSFDPKDIGKSVSDLEKPFFNRAVQGSYPPGSVFKIVSAFAGLESGLIDENTEIEDVGEFELGGAKFSNWFFNKYGKTDGQVKIQKAISRSNDIYFYRLAEKIGLDSLRNKAKDFGLGQKTGIDLPSEAIGVVPDEVWKKSAFDDLWYLGDTLHLSIGQGFLLATPIQINQVTAYVASGKLTKPYLVSKIGSEDEKLAEITPKVLGENLAKSSNLNIVRAGMKDACKLGGTGAPFFNVPYDVGCKTGTAEKELGNPHAWFTVYAPFEKAQIALTVLVEDGGEGSSVAAPVAKEIIDWWMANRN